MMERRLFHLRFFAIVVHGCLFIDPGFGIAEEPPAINPFRPPRGQDAEAGETQNTSPWIIRQKREDIFPGYVELSDGSVYPGMIYLTRDKRLEIYDNTIKEQREIPLRVVQSVECRVLKEWMEKEWRFKELASNEKYYTGRSYPARWYMHRIRLHDDRTITGILSCIVYVQPLEENEGAEVGHCPEREAKRFLLHKRDKGKIGEDLESLRYVRLVKLGEAALQEGRKKAKAQAKEEPSPSAVRDDQVNTP
jgi:hypothetical protein